MCYIANIGDSRYYRFMFRLIIYQGEKNLEAGFYTIDHKPNLPSELERISAKGGEVRIQKARNGESIARVWIANTDFIGKRIFIFRTVYESINW